MQQLREKQQPFFKPLSFNEQNVNEKNRFEVKHFAFSICNFNFVKF